MARTDIHRCYTCGRNEFEDNMLEYNDRFYCSLRCKLTQEREDGERLDCASDVVPIKRE